MRNYIINTLMLLFLHQNTSFSQTNIFSTSTEAEKILLGKFDPLIYIPQTVIDNPKEIIEGISENISTDSLQNYLIKLGSFHNRNTGSDTMSSTNGIGSARRWVYNQFEKYSADNGNRLITSYLQFDQKICNVKQHRNVFCVLPGRDTSNHAAILIEAHMDSRCEDVCDSLCLAEGIDDNGSGTSLVLELARTMSKYVFNNTIIFMITIGEEQGLYGAGAFADYVSMKNINLKAVLNNDIVGGITCGETSSPPSCPAEGHTDSIQLRIFSSGINYSLHKGLARFIKMQYDHEVKNKSTTQMTISLMDKVDREGRGGDHIPFSDKGYTSVRFTSANEHGNGNPDTPGYKDHQHTTKDILGADTDNDGIIDSFYVNFEYLKRNAIINGTAIAMVAQNTITPQVSFTNNSDGITVSILDQTQYLNYKIGMRTDSNDFDAVYTFAGVLQHQIPGIKKDSVYYISIASVDSNGTESLFTKEQKFNAMGTGPETSVIASSEKTNYPKISLLPNQPNPFKTKTTFTVLVEEPFKYKEASILITDVLGRHLYHTPIDLSKKVNKIDFNPVCINPSFYIFTLFIDGKSFQTRKMIVTN